MAGEIRRIWQYIGTHFFRGDVTVGYNQTSPTVYFGGSSASYPAIRRASTTLTAYRADFATYVPFQALNFDAFGNSGVLVRGYGGNIASVSLMVAEEVLTVAAAATSDTVANLLPAKSIILAVSCRVTTVIPTATSFTLGGASAGGPFTDAVSVAATSTDNGMVNVPYLNASAQKVRLTISGSNPANNTGRVRISVFYLASTASIS